MTTIPSAGRTSGSLNEPIPTQAPSVGRLFFDRVAKTPDREAYRAPDAAGGWRSLTWKQTLEEVSELAAGLIALGLKPEDRVAIASGTRLEWILADLAIMCAGGANTTVYPTTSEDDVEFILNDSGSVMVIAEDERQLAKVNEIKANLPHVTKVVLMTGNGDGDFAVSWSDLRAKGRELLAENPGVVEDHVNQTGPDSLATIIYTSGTTGKPKGVELPHSCWTYEGAALDATGVLSIDDVQFLWLPLAHSFGKVLTCFQLQVGFMTAVDGRVPEIINNLPQVQPTFMAGVPRIYEKIYAGVNAQFEGGGAKAKIADWAFRIGKQAAAKRNAGEPVTGALAMQANLANKLVFSKIQARMGGRIRFFISGAAALNRDIAEWFDAAGLPILEGYGLTETSAAACIVRPDSIAYGTVGPPVPGTEAKIAEDGEILLRGGGVMRGYRNRPDANEEVFAHGEGWFATGDIGIIDDQGRVKITDRKKDLVKTAGGKYVALGAIESAFKVESPLVGACVVIANERKYASALVGLDPDAAKKFAQDNGLPDDIAALSKDPKVLEHMQAAFDSLNSKLNKWETIKQFRILPYALDPEGTPDQVTPSMKIKRKAVEANNTDLVNAMYS
jgi:long-chain acyl-CoA synthetase